VVVSEVYDIEGVGGFLSLVMNVEVCGCGDFASFVLRTIDVSDGPWFRYGACGDVEVINEVRGYEAFCSATVDQCADFGMKGSGMEFDKSVYGFLVGNEYGLRE
jgi:hypothetical protein